ncbi:Hypothetical protein CINCED_3A022789 [Cinara cedri]|uniref:Uncharacterized protein n=1 Tax=Cinara cedri TaxID=506608 RepID=A0A5E4MS47_9HEMI|nr:Hypothetical protein CINCED_3A022789 [Cinara cedri]
MGKKTKDYIISLFQAKPEDLVNLTAEAFCNRYMSGLFTPSDCEGEESDE